jgi:hypothetical protein
MQNWPSTAVLLRPAVPQRNLVFAYVDLVLGYPNENTNPLLLRLQSHTDELIADAQAQNIIPYAV